MNTIHIFLSSLSYTFMAIFPVTNPIGMAPIFLALAKQYDQGKRHFMARRIAIYSFFIYWIVLIAGTWIISFFGLSIPIIKVAGGIIIFSAAFSMLQSKPKLTQQEQNEALHKSNDITFFPLTMPITVGAGSMAVAMAIGAGIIDQGAFDLAVIEQLAGATLGIIFLSVSIFFCYYFADRIFAKLGKVGTDVVTQLSAFILLAISVEIFWEGVKALLLSLH